MHKYEHPRLEEMIDNWDDEFGLIELVNNSYKLGAGEWKHLSSEAPSREGRYLVYREGIGGSIGCIDVMYWFAPSGDFFTHSVTHWRELPFPPAGSP